MLCPYIRSSSVGTYDVCPHKYFLTYNLGLQDKAGEKASVGSVIHKALELLALRKLAEQNQQSIVDGEELGQIPIEDIIEENVIVWAFNHYKQLEQSHWNDSKLDECRNILYKALRDYNGRYDPRNHNIFSVEQKFDFSINKDWAKYEYDFGDKIIEGFLSLKGTIDLLIQHDKNTLLCWDWKTGRRSKLSTGKEKKLEDFIDDFQINLYIYSLHHIFPQFKNIIFTIHYIINGGPFTIPIGKDDLPNIELKIKKAFDTISKDNNPKLTDLKWMCRYVCGFSKQQYQNSGKSICEYFHEKIKKDGIHQTFLQYADKTKTLNYQSGGGRSATK